MRPLGGLAKPISARGNVVEAVCPHGNEIPSRRCPCGIHYVPQLGYFMVWMSVASPNLAREPYAISYGLAVGPNAADAVGDPQVQRAQGYRVQAVLVPTRHQRHAQGLRAAYPETSVVAGAVSIVTLRRLAAAADSLLPRIFPV